MEGERSGGEEFDREKAEGVDDAFKKKSEFGLHEDEKDFLDQLERRARKELPGKRKERKVTEEVKLERDVANESALEEYSDELHEENERLFVQSDDLIDELLDLRDEHRGMYTRTMHWSASLINTKDSLNNFERLHKQNERNDEVMDYRRDCEILEQVRNQLRVYNFFLKEWISEIRKLVNETGK